MPKRTSHKLNFFQQAAVSWNRTIPYNATHAVKIERPLDEPRLKTALQEGLLRYGLGRFSLDEQKRRFTLESGPEPQLELLPRGNEQSLRAKLETELNRPFDCERPFAPLRFFAFEDPAGGFYLGIVYFHAVADASSIAYLAGDVVRRYENGAEPARPALAFPRTGLGAWSFARGLFGWLSSLPHDIAEVRRAMRVRMKPASERRVGLLFGRLPLADAASLAARSRELGVTLNDLFLAALMKAVPEGVSESTRRRDRVSVGSIVSTRRDLGLNGGRPFGLFLSSFRVSSKAPRELATSELARDVRRQTLRIKQKRLYLRGILETGFALRLQSLFPATHRERFYAKYYPLAAGLTNIDLGRLWEGGLPAYWRAVSTSEAVPLVFSVTTARDGLAIAASFSTHVYSREQAHDAIEHFVAALKELL